MAILNPPGWIQALSTHTAAQLRTYLASLQAGMFSSATSLRARGGVHPGFGGEFNVTQAGSPNMTVLVDSGACSIPGSESSSQGNYFAVNDASATLSITAAHATLARIDIVVVNVRDAQYSGVSNDVQLQVIAGTPASSPAVPTAPANSITVAQIAVGAAVTSIVNANITDVRDYCASLGGVINSRNLAAAPTSAQIVEGQMVWSNIGNTMYVWDGSAYNQMYPGYQKISETIASGATATVTFSSIPSTFRNLRILVTCRSDAAVLATPLNMRFNSDTGANYHYQTMAAQQAALSAAEGVNQTSLGIREMTGASAAASHPASFTIDVPWYGGTTFFKNALAQATWNNGTATGAITIWNTGGHWRNTGAITSITLLPGSGNFISGSSFALYGMP